MTPAAWKAKPRLSGAGLLQPSKASETYVTGACQQGQAKTRDVRLPYHHSYLAFTSLRMGSSDSR